MSIDISTDLNITLLAKSKSTPTLTGIYDVGNPAGTYIPGKDFSATDDVSTGNTVQYTFSIAFDSVSNQLYTLDKVFIQSVDDPTVDGTGQILGYWINTNPDPTNIIDDGQNTLIPQYYSNMSSIVFDSSANIKSDSTVTTGITVTLPISFWWKSKIMPKICIIAIKDGIEKASDPLQLDTVRLSTAANIPSSLSPHTITYTTQASQTGFLDNFFMGSLKQIIYNITPMNDEPDFELVTYKVDYNAAVNGLTIPLTKNNFSITFISNGTLVDYDYTNEVFTITLKQKLNGSVSVIMDVFIPFNPGSLKKATVTINGDWISNLPVTFTNFMNQYLFTLSNVGTLTRSVEVIIVPEQPVNDPILSNSISGNLQTEKVYQSLSYRYYSCPRTKDSTVIRMIDSEIATFAKTITTQYQYYVGNQFYFSPLPSDSYTVLYGHYDFIGTYDANIISQQVINGTIPLKTYDEIISENKTPNIMALSITKELFDGITVNYDNFVTFRFDGDLDVLTQDEFRTLYNTSPNNSYPTYMYSYMSLNTCYTTVSEANSAVGSYLSSVDSFTLRNSHVYLNLGTVNKQASSGDIGRFNAISTVRALLPFDTIDANILYSITDINGYNVNTITDYTKEYCLTIQFAGQAGSDNADVNIPDGTIISVTLPNNLVQYMYLTNQPYVKVLLPGDTFGKVNIINYILQGNNLTFTVPVEINFRPDSICIPVKFITPSNDLTTTLLSITFSNPLVYKGDPQSLIYGFTTDSMMFKVNTFSRPLTLKGAQIDTTGLSVYPPAYDRGQVVTYVATVYNQTFSPSSNYYMSMTVPTNKYNPVESSNNNLNAYITGINLTNPNTTLYYQTESNVTVQDIYMMKHINIPGGPTLKQYYDSTIVSSWFNYVPGQIIPAKVVMIVGYTPGVTEKSLVRIDYNVVVDIPASSNETYINDAVFNYYSSGSNLEAQSNVVEIRNRTVDKLPITKLPSVQSKPLENNIPVLFTASFNAPIDYLIFTNFKVIDKLHPSLELDTANTKVVAFPNTPIVHTVNYDENTNTVSIDIPNNSTTAGKLILITIATTVIDTTKIPMDPVYAYPIIKNTVDLVINNNPQLTSTSNEVIVLFVIQPPKPILIRKEPLTQIKPLLNGTAIQFMAKFIAPSETRVYENFTLIDILHPSLTFDDINTKVTVSPNTNIPFTSNVDSTTNTLTIKFPNNQLTTGKEVTVIIATTLTDLSKIPTNLIITNNVDLIINDDATSKKTSNTVELKFSKAACPRDQAITDLIESIALEEAALSHILNAEGENIQKIIALNNTSIDIVLKTNKSVKNMINSISNLEITLKSKLDLFKDCLCKNNSEN